MLLLSKVRKVAFSVLVRPIFGLPDLRGRSVRPICEVWEAVILSLAQTDQRANQGAASHGLTDRPHRSASQIWESENRPHKHTASQLLSCDLSEPIREHGLSRAQPLRSVRPWESKVRSDSSGRGNAFSREISQTAPRQTASPGVRGSPIGL